MTGIGPRNGKRPLHRQAAIIDLTDDEVLSTYSTNSVAPEIDLTGDGVDYDHLSRSSGERPDLVLKRRRIDHADFLGYRDQ
jgi:hypothetical protein